ncbi:MAG: hypothetical protein JNK31_00980 [Candidatus Competibacter sp.]|nr:hypothetical protein [Candidatus Competibacter sp.]
MSKKTFLALLTRCASVVGLVGAMAAPLAAAPSALPLALKRVLLSSGGVGYFEYEAQVEGAAELTLEAPLNQMDDILKSLIVYDEVGAVNHITLPGKESLDQIFRDLPFGATALNSTVELLNALQGADVEIKGGSALRGRLLKVTAETTLLPNQLGSTVRHRVAVMTPQGLQQAILEEVETLRFADPALQEQLQKALAAVSEHRAHHRRALRLQVKGEGKRRVRAGYVVEAPLWKTSYRLNLEANPQPDVPARSRLQGWALLENMSGQDWDGVELTLASGNPVTFRQALYQAYFVKRPDVPVEVLGRVLPRLDTGTVALAPAPAAPPPVSAMAPQEEADQAMNAAEAPAAKSFGRRLYTASGGTASVEQPEPTASQEGVEQVLFKVPAPVSVKNGYAVLLPIADRAVPTLRVSLYQPETQEHYPLASVQLTNDTATGLPPGAITIYEQAGYLGDGRLSALPVGDKRLVSFAVDTKINVNKNDEQSSAVSKGKISGGMFYATRMDTTTTRYRIKSLHSEDRLLWIEHPHQGDWKLVAPDPATVELTPEAYRIPRVLNKNAETELPVVFEYAQEEVLALTDLSADQIMAYASSSQLDEALKQAFAKIGEARSQIDRLKKEIEQVEQQRQALFKDQERLRENLGRVPANSDLAKRYLKTLDAQENTLEASHASLQQKNAELENLRRQFEKKVQDLTL